MKQNNCWSFASDTDQSSTSGQSFIITELEDGKEFRNKTKHNNYESSESDTHESSNSDQKEDENETQQIFITRDTRKISL